MLRVSVTQCLMDTDKATRAPAAGRYDLRSGIAADVQRDRHLYSGVTGTCRALRHDWAGVQTPETRGDRCCGHLMIFARDPDRDSMAPADDSDVTSGFNPRGRIRPMVKTGTK